MVEASIELRTSLFRNLSVINTCLCAHAFAAFIVAVAGGGGAAAVVPLCFVG